MRHEEPENHDRWLVSYADFITLLFAFFVVLYATSNANEEKLKKLEESLRNSLSLPQPKAAGVGSGMGQDWSFDAVFDSLMGNRVHNPLESKNLSQTKTERGTKITMVASTYFNTADAKLKKTSIESLKQLAEILKETPGNIIVEGHTDDLPIKNEEYLSNWDLSSIRASRVARYLMVYGNIPASRISVRGYADQKPLVPNDSEAHRATNRRIEVWVEPAKD